MYANHARNRTVIQTQNWTGVDGQFCVRISLGFRVRFAAQGGL